MALPPRPHSCRGRRELLPAAVNVTPPSQCTRLHPQTPPTRRTINSSFGCPGTELEFSPISATCSPVPSVSRGFKLAYSSDEQATPLTDECFAVKIPTKPLVDEHFGEKIESESLKKATPTQSRRKCYTPCKHTSIKPNTVQEKKIVENLAVKSPKSPVVRITRASAFNKPVSKEVPVEAFSIPGSVLQEDNSVVSSPSPPPVQFESVSESVPQQSAESLSEDTVVETKPTVLVNWLFNISSPNRLVLMGYKE